MCVQGMAHQLYHDVGDLLEEDDDPGGLPVVLGVGPDEADDVEQCRDPLLQLHVVTLLHLLQVGAQRLQMHAGGGQ